MSDDTEINAMGLSMRATSALFNRNIRTVGQAKEVILTGAIKRFRNCGPTTIAEIALAVGVPLPNRVKTWVMSCPHCRHRIKMITTTDIAR